MLKEARLMNPSDLRTSKCFVKDNRNFGAWMDIEIQASVYVFSTWDCPALQG